MHFITEFYAIAKNIRSELSDRLAETSMAQTAALGPPEIIIRKNHS